MAPLKVYSLRNRTKTVSAITTVQIPVTAEISSYNSARKNRNDLMRHVEAQNPNNNEVHVYVDPSGHKCYSKPEVLRYIKPVEQEGSTSNVPLIELTNERPTWLPLGWNLELKTSKSRSGKTYKCYVDPSARHKFFSKPQVLKFLNGVKQKKSKSNRKGKGMPLSMVPTSKVTNKNSAVEGLPPGWIKITKYRKSTCTTKIKDPFYIDPVNGYVFRSKRDAQRYLDTGEISSRVTKPKKRNIEGETPSSSATKRPKLEHPVAKQQIGGRAPLRVYSLRNRTKTLSPITTVPKPVTAEISSNSSPNSESKAPVIPKGDDLDRKKDENVKKKAKSKPLKWLDSPRRCSRLSGVKPGQLTLPETVRPSDDETLTRSEPGKELLMETSLDANIPLLRDPLTESQGCDTDSPMLTIEASEKSQVEKVSAENLPVITPEADKKQEKSSLESKKKKVRNANNSKASTKKNEIVSILGEKSMPFSGIDASCVEKVNGEDEKQEKSSLESKKKKVRNANNSKAARKKNEIVKEASILGEKSMPFSGIDASCVEKVNGGDALSDNPSKARRKKTKFNAEQLEILERSFELDRHPKPERRMELAQALGLEPINIQVWFQNRRSKLKKLLESDRDFLQKEFEASQAGNQYLHAEDESGWESPSPFLGEMSNNNWPFVDTYASFEDNMQTLEFSKSHDKKSDLEFGEIFSDPCLEFAFKTLTGELPIESPIDEPISTPPACIIGEMGRTIKANKKLSLPHEPLEFRPDPVTRPIDNTRFIDSSRGLGLVPNNLQVSEKQEQRPFVSFDHWSDRSFDSAFKALAGSTPAKSCFDHPVGPASQTEKDSGSALPDFGWPGFFQTDISVHFDASDKLLFSQPPIPINNPALFTGGSAFSTTTTTTAQPPPPPVMKKKRGRPPKVNN